MTKFTPTSAMTLDEIKARISLLSDEIDANEEETWGMLDEINRLYAEIDAKENNVLV
ncbi:hypothetical protein [Herminiimonas sp. CN]|uniref:hypothetical protein n=1 Tax=Herminiimonas sp. CN TaxID=1349818 RepID=UPI0012DC903D|nr:hypothetical protein [Herminiimonas sp. CN]